jgi:hypothetical protein
MLRSGINFLAAPALRLTSPSGYGSSLKETIKQKAPTLDKWFSFNCKLVWYN